MSEPKYKTKWDWLQHDTGYTSKKMKEIFNVSYHVWRKAVKTGEAPGTMVKLAEIIFKEQWDEAKRKAVSDEKTN